MNRCWLIVFLLILLCCVTHGRVGFTIGSSLAVHKKAGSRSKHLDKASTKGLTSLKKIKSLKKAEEVVETPAQSSSGKQKTLQTVIQLSFSLLSMFLSGKIRKLDYTNKDILKASRFGYFGYLLFCYSLHSLLVYRIKKVNDLTILPRKVDPMSAILNVVLNKPSKPQQSVKDYDLEEANKMIKSLAVETGIILVAHGLLKYNAPLLLLPLMQVSSKLQNPLVQIHLLGFKAVDALQRPFQSGFERFLSTVQPAAEDANKSQESQTPAASPAIATSKTSEISAEDRAEDDLSLPVDDNVVGDESEPVVVSDMIDTLEESGMDISSSSNSSGEVVNESYLEDEDEDEDEQEESVH